MNVKIKKLPKSQVELTIAVPYETYLKGEKMALEEISKELKIDGFRAGHIPEDVIRKHVKEEAIRATAMEKILPQTYADAVKKHNIQVIAPPKVDIKSPIKKEGDELVYVATVAIMPEAKVGDYKKIKVAHPKVKVGNKQIEETIQMVLDRSAEWKDVKRKAKKEDRVEVAFEGFDDKGNSIPNTASKNHPVILGSNTMIPGFEDKIIGMNIGEDKEFDITFPKNYHATAMQGKKVKFKVTLGRLEEKIEQKLDKELIKKVTGQEQSVADFKKAIEADLLNEMNMRAKQEHDNKVVQEIIKITKADLPDMLIEEEIKYMLKDQKERIKQQGLTWEQYLKHIKKTEEDFIKDHQKIAKERILARLGTQVILKDAKIEVSDEKVNEKINELASRYPEDQQKHLREHYKKESDNYRGLKNNIAADKLIEMLTK